VKKLSQSFQQIYYKTCKKNKDIVYLLMPHIKGSSRQQLQVVRLEETVSQDNEVRFIDAFVHSIKLERIGFRERGCF
jgi:hypothetical protein